MYQHYIEAMTGTIKDWLVDVSFPESKLEDARWAVRQALQHYWLDKIAIIWTTEDVHEATSDELTEEQAREVLEYVLDHYDQDDGVNLEIIKNAIDDCKDKWRLQ